MSWAYIPQSSACLPDTEGSSWASTALSEALERCVWSRGKPSPSQTWSRRCKRAPWLRLLSGLTSQPSTAEVGALTSSQRGSHANPGAAAACGSDSMTTAGSGQMSLVLSERPARPSSSSNALLASDEEACRLSSTTLPLSGSMGPSGVLSQPPKRARRTDVPGSSSWPTPTASSYGNCVGGAAGRVGPVRHSLNTLAAMWPTPTQDPMRSRSGERKGERTLHKLAKNWPTPAVSDSRSPGRHTTTTGVMHPGTSLTDAMRSHRDPTTSKAGDDGQGPMVLNPAFVEALMLGSAGIGHTEYACWATGCVQHRPLEPSGS